MPLSRSVATPDRVLAKPRWIERGLIALSVIAIGWFYLWTVAPETPKGLTSRDDASYYNLLVRGMLKGHLSLDVPSDPFLDALPNPYDPAARGPHGMHDASYYRGKYYVYFGVTPVVLLYLPFHLLTGTYISDHCAIVVFVFAGFLFGLAIVRSVIRDHFPLTPAGVRLACVWALGLANMVPPLLRRAAMWEVPISCAYALFMLTLFCVWRAMAKQGALRWAVAGSLAMGLCIGARPVYLAGAVVLLAPLGLAGLNLGRKFWRQGQWWRLATATALPIMVVGSGLAVYNHLRFGSPVEFGQSYQLAGAEDSKLVHFSPSYLPFNLRIYLFSLPGFSPYFPFLTVIHPPPAPPGQFGIEDPYGIVPGMPWVLFSFGAAWLALRRRDVLGMWCGATLASVVLTLAMIGCFGGNTGRYQVDFAPGLTLLAAVGVAWFTAELAGSGWKLGAVTLTVVLAVWSSGFNILLSFQHNRLLAMNHPALYAQLAWTFNHVPHWVGKLKGYRAGPVEIELIFPQDRPGQIEPLVTTGHEFLADYIFVHYLDNGMIRFGLEHTSRGTWVGAPVKIDPAAEHKLIVQMGSLYPPRAHPAYDGLSAEETEARTQTLKVLLDGRTVLHATVQCYDSSELQPSIGTSGPYRPGFKHDFSGRILGWRRLPSLPSDFTLGQTGKLHLLIRLPAFSRPHNEPLLSSGVAGEGDLIYIRYVDANHFQLGHDRWGYGGTQSPVIEYNPNEALDLDISCPPLLKDGGEAKLVVLLNSQPILDCSEAFHPSKPTQIAIGRNQIGASTAESEFTGTIELQERLTK